MAGERTKQDNAQGIDNSSGVAKAYDFDRLNTLLCAKAAMLMKGEQRIAHLVLRWAGKADAENIDNTGTSVEDETISLIKYPDEFDVRGLPDEFDIASNLSLLEAPPTVRRQQMNLIIDKLFPRLAKDLKAAMLSELKEWPADPMEQAQEMATIQATVRNAGTTGTIKQTPGGAPVGPKPRGASRQGQNNKGAKS
jgi:hypothetical protein